MKTNQEVERMRVRAKMGDDMREFLDAARELFPNCRLVGIRFSDGETIGRADDGTERAKH